MVLTLLLITLVLFPADWQEIELSFISRDFKEILSYSFTLPPGYKQINYSPGERGRQTIIFQYPCGAIFYITNDSNCHPNSSNLQHITEWAPGAGNNLVDNELLADPFIRQQYCIPNKTDFYGHNFRYRWWRDIETYEISYGYLRAPKKWKGYFEQVLCSMRETRQVRK